jgi:hypothetical protein
MSSGQVAEEDFMALDFIIWRLQSLRTTIKVDQFFPRSYFSERFQVERNFDFEYIETFVTLRDFIKKHILTAEESWGSHASLEVETFQTYDAPDFRKYLAVILNGTARPEDTNSKVSPSTSNKTSSETTPLASDVSASSSKDKPTSGSNIAPTNGKLCDPQSVTKNGTSNEDRNSVNTDNSKSSRSSKMKAKFKTVFSLGLKKKCGGKSSKTGTNGKVNGRTEALLATHGNVVPQGVK